MLGGAVYVNGDQSRPSATVRELLKYICGDEVPADVIPAQSIETTMWPVPNVMAALPNIGGALCSTPHSVADAHFQSAMQ